MDILKVQLKHINPMITSVSGENIALPNRFSFDVIPVDPDNASSCVALGELRRLDGLNRFRRVLPDESDGVLAELQEVISRTQETSSSVASTAGSQTEKDGAESAILGPSTTVKPRHIRLAPSSEDEVRFQKLLSRLDKSQSESGSQTEAPRAASGQVVDPAIVAMKVKGKVEGSEGSAGAVDQEAANQYLARQLNHLRNLGQQQSFDSGYGSNESLRNPNGPLNVAQVVSRAVSQHPRKESSDGQGKSLNPAAAEFKSRVHNDAIPRFSPKKLFRTPLRRDIHFLKLLQLEPIPPTTTNTSGNNGTGNPNSNPNATANPNKPQRPYFPVTTKPRDHDPVKQQMYEAYLEWRKVNEPGYHMKCKMRQAQRALRQTQVFQPGQQPQQQVGGKGQGEGQQMQQVKAEKAKAAVGARAAAALAERECRKEKVRNELKAKVRELSRESDKWLVKL
ncbi:hypothetical protein N0V88_000911 [Collariella sp. IMI 366227]|nr:hypothetical protein N0V88_000911 [Collariella sp. IMI 366227]